jgi:4,5-DOPA dioxygenase extradiol
MPSTSRKTHNSGISGDVSTACAFPFKVNLMDAIRNPPGEPLGGPSMSGPPQNTPISPFFADENPRPAGTHRTKGTMSDSESAVVMPSLFLGHGSPMNALADNVFTRAWSALGTRLPRPRAILCLSAHWYTNGSSLTIATAPRTIHDFGGFPRELYLVQYPAPGDPDLAHRVRQLLAPLPTELDDQWGLDHGTWSVLRHLYPHADVPVVQLSIDGTKPAAFHYEVGQRLAPLRREGVLILGSGNVVHNLSAFIWGRNGGDIGDSAEIFDARVRHLIAARDYGPVIQYESLGREAAFAVPTPEHYYPLLYTLGAGTSGDEIQFPVEGIAGGAISMLAVQVG